ncbi:transcriptional coactivator/pterin dehydratase, partial [Sphaerulina musiva SO2202]
WKLTKNKTGIERNFRFKTFKNTWAFMSEIAAECNKPQVRHHPEWSNVYNFTRVRWTTHWPEGISGKDLEMARFCDEVARR